MGIEATTKDYWIAPNAVSIILNALGDANRIQGNVASGAVVSCYIESIGPGGENGDGLRLDNGRNPKRWPLSFSPTFFNSDSEKYVYAAIPRSSESSTMAVVVFPSERLDIYGKNSEGSQIGSVDYFYVFLRGIISEPGGDPRQRSWSNKLDFGTLGTYADLTDLSQSDWYRYDLTTQIVTLLKNIYMSDDSSFLNLRLNGKELDGVVDEQTPVYNDSKVVTPAYALSKKHDDTAAGLITFLRGIALGTGYGITEEGRATLRSVLSNNFTPDLLTGTGWGAWLDENGISTIEVDNLNVRMKAVFSELEIRKISHSGGNLLFSSAGSKIQSVTPLDANGNETTAANAVAYRCDLFSDDGTTATMNDWWKDDQARCQQFNIQEGVYQNVSNRSYWRKVIDTESRTDEKGNIVNSVIIAAKSSGTYKGESFTKGQSSLYNDVPQAGDTIVQLGNQNPNNRQRQNAIELVTDGDNAPALLKYQGIDDYTLDGKLVQGEYYDSSTHTFKSKTYGDWYVGRKESDMAGGYAEYDSATRTLNIQGKLKVGSTLEDGRDINHLGTSRGNLLKNTGFTGDFESVEVETEGQTITDVMPIYSDPLKHWDATNVEVIADTDSASGYSAKLGVLAQTVDGGWKEGEWYMLSLRAAQGSLTIEAGGEAKVATLTDWERIDFPFQASTTDGVVRFSGTAKVCEIMLTAGNLPTEWHKASTDNDKSMAEFFGLDYLRKAITDATTNIIGGLVMTQILKVGNYRGGQMSQETGGMSGAYNDDKSPFLWGGGTMEDAIYTIMKYAKNPAYQPTEEEVSRMAKFVVTHGGRAILNDIVLRGYVYALGGLFKGNLDVGSNGDHFTLDGNTNAFTVTGPSSVIDTQGYPPDPQATQIDIFKVFTETDPDTLTRVARMFLSSALGYSITFDAEYGIHITTPSGLSLTLRDDTIEATQEDGVVAGKSYKTILSGYGIELYTNYPDGYRHMTDDLISLMIHSDGQFAMQRAGSGSVSGALKVDSNGFLKIE